MCTIVSSSELQALRRVTISHGRPNAVQYIYLGVVLLLQVGYMVVYGRRVFKPRYIEKNTLSGMESIYCSLFLRITRFDSRAPNAE